jgi:2'-5' RNA ligase
MTDATWRLFVAIELPETWLVALAAWQEQARLDLALPGRGLRWTRPEGLHLTLKFLGEVAEARIPRIEAALRGVVAERPRFSLEPGRIGSFGSRNRPRSLWLGLGGDLPAITELATAVDIALAGAGFDREGRPFRPHITLARVPEGLDQTWLHRIAALTGKVTPSLPPFSVDGVRLFRSHLGPGGSRYDRLLHAGFAMPA